MSNHPHILKAIQTELWAITPDALNQIIAITQGLGDPEAVAAKLGRPLTNARNVTLRDNVAIVPITGPLFRYANCFTDISGATSIQSLATDLQTAVDDPSIKAVVLEIDSPGGQIAGISEFAAQIRAANSIKPVTAYISDTGASAAYWLASAAGSIVVADTARIGSIGVVMQASILDEEGTIKFISSQSPLKHADPGSDTGKLQYQKTVDALAEVFINAVAGYRGTTRENVIANYGYGGMHIAADAVAAGMADKLGLLEAVIAQLSSTQVYRPGSVALTSNQPRGNSIMSQPITRETLAADYPDLVKALTEEGYAAGVLAGKAQGAEAERLRIQSIEALATLGHDALVAQFKFDGTTTAADAALKILGAEKINREDMAKKLAADTPVPVPHASAAFNDGGAVANELTGVAKWEDEYQHSTALQKEFPTIGAYVAYQKASEKGLVKRLGEKA
jgi:ClpP class serine protease